MAAEVHPEIRVRYKYIVSMMAHEKLLEKSDSPPLFSRWPNHDHRDRGAQFLERGLTAILAADVIEYSRLMSDDQDSTLAAPRLLRTEIFGPVVEANGGMVVKRMGDGWIVEFASVADAVRCALHIQQALSDHEIIRLRMGIHTGDVVFEDEDVVFEDEDVLGDGVNVAARLEELAVPGEVLISDTAHALPDRPSIAVRLFDNFNRFVTGKRNLLAMTVDPDLTLRHSNPEPRYAQQSYRHDRHRPARSVRGRRPGFDAGRTRRRAADKAFGS